MSTHAVISAVQPDGTIRAVYCHWDGTIEHHGPILTAHYATQDRVSALLDLGSLSELGTQVGHPHDFPSHYLHTDWCLAYDRDRGDTDAQARVLADEAALFAFADECGAASVFLYRDGAWLSYSGRTASWYAVADAT